MPLLSPWPPLCHFSHNEPLETPQTCLRAPPTAHLNTNYSLAWNDLTAFIYPSIIRRYLGALCPPQPIYHTNPNTMLSACCFPCPCVSRHHQSRGAKYRNCDTCMSAQHVPSQGSRLLTYPWPSLYHMLPLVSTFTSQLYEWLWNYLCPLLHP